MIEYGIAGTMFGDGKMYKILTDLENIVYTDISVKDIVCFEIFSRANNISTNVGYYSVIDLNGYVANKIAYIPDCESARTTEFMISILHGSVENAFSMYMSELRHRGISYADKLEIQSSQPDTD